MVNIFMTNHAIVKKQVESFRYYRKVIPVIQSIIDNKKVGA